MRLAPLTQHPSVCIQCGTAGRRVGRLVGALAVAAPWWLLVVTSPQREVMRIEGPLHTVIWLHNLSTLEASAGITLYASIDGQALAANPRDPIAPRTNYAWFVREYDIPDGLYSARSLSQHAVTALRISDLAQWRRIAWHDRVQPGRVVLLPFWRRSLHRTSLIAVQNATAQTSTEAMLYFYPNGSDTPLIEPLQLQPGQAQVLNLGTDPQFQPLGEGAHARGVVEVRAGDGSELAVESLINVDSSPLAMYDVVGVPAARASRRAYAPLIQSNYSDRHYYTRLHIVNPTADRPVTVAITYTAEVSSSLGAGEVITDTKVVAPRSLLEISHACPVEGGDPLASVGCAAPQGSGWIGAAAIQADGDIVAWVTRHSDVVGTAAGYLAGLPSAPGTKWSVPYVRNRWGGRTTGITVYNRGPVQAQVDIRYTGPMGEDYGSDRAVLPAGRSKLFDQGTSSRIPPKYLGSALLLSDQPLVVMVYDAAPGDGWTGLDDGMYNAIDMADVRPGDVQLHPLVFKRQVYDFPATPTITPTPTHTPTVTLTPTVTHTPGTPTATFTPAPPTPTPRVPDEFDGSVECPLTCPLGQRLELCLVNVGSTGSEPVAELVRGWWLIESYGRRSYIYDGDYWTNSGGLRFSLYDHMVCACRCKCDIDIISYHWVELTKDNNLTSYVDAFVPEQGCPQCASGGGCLLLPYNGLTRLGLGALSSQWCSQGGGTGRVR